MNSNNTEQTYSQTYIPSFTVTKVQPSESNPYDLVDLNDIFSGIYI